MIIIKSDSDLRRMRRAGEITGMTLKAAEAAIKPGMSTKELDGIIEDFIRSRGAVPQASVKSSTPRSYVFCRRCCGPVI